MQAVIMAAWVTIAPPYIPKGTKVRPFMALNADHQANLAGLSYGVARVPIMQPMDPAKPPKARAIGFMRIILCA